MPDFTISLWAVICLLALTGCGITSDLKRKPDLSLNHQLSTINHFPNGR